MDLLIGDTRILTIHEQDLTGIDQLLRSATHEAVAEIGWLRPHFVADDGTLLGSIQMFVVEHRGQVVVVDTCVGNGKNLPVQPEWSGLDNDVLGRMAIAGVDPADVDVVLCTHMHLDHVGWNTRRVGDRWMPTFPNARYLFDRTEFEHWMREGDLPFVERAGDSERMTAFRATFHRTQGNVLAESIRPVIDAGLVELVDAPCEPVPDLRLVPTHGHTPGHVSVEIVSGDARALITGDSFHHPCQIARPDWFAVVDHDREESTTTRRRILDAAADTDVVVVGTHFAEPAFGRIARDGDGYRFVTA